jgi:hypothetical protein
LCAPRIVGDARPAKSQRVSGAGGDREGARVRVEHDAVYLGIGRERYVSDIGQGKSRCVGRPVRHRHWSPVGGRVPVAGAWTRIPSCAAGKDQCAGCVQRDESHDASDIHFVRLSLCFTIFVARSTTDLLEVR